MLFTKQSYSRDNKVLLFRVKNESGYKTLAMVFKNGKFLCDASSSAYNTLMAFCSDQS